MTIADVALIATLVMLVVAAIDVVRGKTAMGRFRMSKKDEDPSRFWFAIVLYINMAFGMFWLAGQARDTVPQDTSSEEQSAATTKMANP